ncbi:hypothetical protein [Sphaerisporangium dianthi]|uniref:Streptomyces killer toxin-like beta/gamma crystallin domain-containing protein n=1 Tax=Sphaerisporangium dianthi TaxID=1436120 RepID=A0ABV9CEN3_9ACTN
MRPLIRRIRPGQVRTRAAARRGGARGGPRRARAVVPAVALAAAAVLPASAASPASAATAPGTASAVAFAGSFCYAGQWTQVHWYVNPFWPMTYRYTVPSGGYVRWRFFSGGVPPYWEGGFSGSTDIWTPPSPYTSIEFLCVGDSNVTITGL